MWAMCTNQYGRCQRPTHVDQDEEKDRCCLVKETDQRTVGEAAARRVIVLPIEGAQDQTGAPTIPWEADVLAAAMRDVQAGDEVFEHGQGRGHVTDPLGCLRCEHI